MIWKLLVVLNLTFQPVLLTLDAGFDCGTRGCGPVPAAAESACCCGHLQPEAAVSCGCLPRTPVHPEAPAPGDPGSLPKQKIAGETFATNIADVLPAPMEPPATPRA